MNDRWLLGLVAVIAGGSFYAGWMARYAQFLARREVLYRRQVKTRPALYDWSSEEDAGE